MSLGTPLPLPYKNQEIASMYGTISRFSIIAEFQFRLWYEGCYGYKKFTVKLIQNDVYQ